MIEHLEEIDRLIVFSVNSWHSPFMDELMWWISQRLVWIPLYLTIAYLAWTKLDRRTFVFFVICTIASVALANAISVHLFKDVLMRYRPSHHAELTEQLHFYRMPNGDLYKGGLYGFVSSHAANFFCFALFVGLALRKQYRKLLWILIAVAILVSFSRLYQGVHYLSDLVGGALVGGMTAYVMYRFLYLKLINRT